MAIAGNTRQRKPIAKASEVMAIVPNLKRVELPSYNETDDRFPLLWIAFLLCVVVITTAALYFARTVLLPIATAAILSVVFTPLANRLERYFGRLIGAILVVLVMVVVISTIGYFLTVELTAVADRISGYSTNIGSKLAAVEKNTPLWLQHIQDAIYDVQRHLTNADPTNTARPPRTVMAMPIPAPLVDKLADRMKPIIPVAQGLVNALLVIMLMFFLLYSRKDLRDRFVRLAARGRVPIAAQAIETANNAVGRYLLLFSLINLAFGVATGTAAWMLGLPNAALWGVIGFLLRFIPYVGAISAALLPAIAAFALFPGWSKALEILGAFVVIDQVAAQAAEPIIIGRGIDVSPVALLIAAMYWSWLWGIPGLLLSTPLTACLKVAGDYIPPLGFLAILLGADRVLDDYHDFYRMLLELNPGGARDLAIAYCDENGIERTFDEVIGPALVLMGDERAEDHIGDEYQRLIIDTSKTLIGELGSRFVKSRISPSLRVLGVIAPGEVHSLGLLMLLELLRKDGVVASFAGEDKSREEIGDLVKRFAPRFIFVSCMTAECIPPTMELISRLHSLAPGVTIIAGGEAALPESAALLEAGCSQVCLDTDKARREVRRYLLQRATSRVAGAVRLPRGYAQEKR
jgi:predicted PurR-regulated permease PerM